MPSFQDSAVLVLLALLLFGPKKLPVLARQLGKLMGDFRRASNEFRTQMEEELRISEQTERQKQVAAIEASAPPQSIAPPIPEPEHPHLPPPAAEELSAETSASYEREPLMNAATDDHAAQAPVAPVPIASSGDLSILPPATGLPIANSRTSVAEQAGSSPDQTAADQSVETTAARETEMQHG